MSSIKPDCPANGMGKAKSSGANLAPLHPPVLATDETVRCECVVLYLVISCHENLRYLLRAFVEAWELEALASNPML